MESEYIYQRSRKAFGCHPYFHDKDAEMIYGSAGNSQDGEAYIARDPIEFEANSIPIFSTHDINTSVVATMGRGMMHVEGGWPKEVDLTEFNTVERYKNKMLKEQFAEHLQNLTNTAESCAKQNNSIDIYEKYDFPDTQDEDGEVEAPSAKTITVLRDPDTAKGQRTVACISWAPPTGDKPSTKLAVAYADFNFQAQPDGQSANSYIWDINNPNDPEQTLESISPLCSIQFNTKDSNLVLGGMYNGLLGIWDLRDRRKGAKIMTQVEVSHHDPVYNVSWTMSKTMTEFMSVSTDGQVKWWDTKKMADAPLDTWELDGKDGTPLNISALCYEATAAPTKFLCGTEQGRTVNCNKKAKGPNDRITQEYGPAGGGHFGPVVGIARNPFHQKNFITVGDWSTKIWFEDFNKLPIMTSSCSSSFMTCCQWAPNRAGVFFTGAHDGDFCVWDYYYKQSEPVVKLNVDGGIHCMAVNSSGSLVATGGNEGTVSLLQLSDSLVESADRHEKNVIEDMFARELKREKLLEQKYREAKSHKLKPPKVTETNNPAQMAEKYMLEETEKNVDKEFFKLLAPGNPDGATETE